MKNQPSLKETEVIPEIVVEIQSEPTPSFITKELHDISRAVEVSGHIRNLPTGWHASQEKIEEARRRNIKLLDGQTFINSYMKGYDAA